MLGMVPERVSTDAGPDKRVILGTVLCPLHGWALMNGYLCLIVLCQRHRQNFPLLLSPQIYQGPESNTEVCTFHPGVPVFHEG